jgi:hypothetical protein
MAFLVGEVNQRHTALGERLYFVRFDPAPNGEALSVIAISPPAITGAQGLAPAIATGTVQDFWGPVEPSELEGLPHDAPGKIYRVVLGFPFAGCWQVQFKIGDILAGSAVLDIPAFPDDRIGTCEASPAEARDGEGEISAGNWSLRGEVTDWRPYETHRVSLVGVTSQAMVATRQDRPLPFLTARASYPVDNAGQLVMRLGPGCWAVSPEGSTTLDDLRSANSDA